MAFIGRSLFRVDEAKRGCPPHDDQVDGAIHPADFDDIAAGLRQCAAGLRAGPTVVPANARTTKV
jgi:hypothetical protein